MKYMTLLSPLSIIALSLLLTACDSPSSPQTEKDRSFSEQGLPLSQRQQEDSAAGVKFGEQQHFPPLSPPPEEQP